MLCYSFYALIISQTASYVTKLDHLVAAWDDDSDIATTAIPSFGPDAETTKSPLIDPLRLPVIH